MTIERSVMHGGPILHQI